MFRILLNNSLRSLISQRPYSGINIAGLSIGIAAVLMLIIWISVETSFDKFHLDSGRIYRVALNLRTPNKIIREGSINAPAGPEFIRAFPAIEEMVRLVPSQKAVISDDETYNLEILYADSTFFRMFSFDILVGDKSTCLQSPQGIVLTGKSAEKIFGSADPLGKTILISGKSFTVTAIAKDPPVNTNIRFDCLASMKVAEKEALHIGWDGGLTCYTYLKLVNGADPEILEKQIHEYMEDVINKRMREFGFELIPYLQKIGDIHLDSKTEFDMGEKGSRARIYLFSGIGLLILLIACFNFINISTALSFRRAREVSIKKIFGSDRTLIIFSFVIESAIAILIALLFALLLTMVLLPATSVLLGKALSMSDIKPLEWMVIIVSLFLFCTVFASFYSSLYLSASSPLALLSNINRGRKRQFTRNALVIFQYTISAALIICSLVIYKQMQYVKNSDKGFDERNILMIDLNEKTSESHELIRSRISSLPGVVSASAVAGGSPGLGFTSNGYVPEGADKPIMSNAVYVDEYYLKTMGISLAEGRDFRTSKAERNKVIINETFSKMMGWKSALGKSINRNNVKYEIIGVVKDFHTATFHDITEPVFISLINELGSYEKMVVKYQPGSINEILGKSKTLIKEISPEYPFEYQILEESLDGSYAREQKLNTLFLILSVISIFISSLGLYGLTTFATQSRAKEICIRKTNGALISDIIREFNYELLKLILVSFVFAVTAGWFAMEKWLNSFAYKTTIGWPLIITACFFTLLAGLITVSWAAYRPAKSNPAETLRKE